MKFIASSCCCFSLRTGVLILGYWSLIVSGLFIIGSGLFFSIDEDQLEEMIKKQSSSSINEEQIKLIITYLRILVTFLFALSLYGFIISIFLLLGVYQNREKFLLVNVISSLVGMGLTVLIAVFQIIAAFITGHIGDGLFIFIRTVLALMLQAYFTIVIHSYRLQIIEENKRRAVQKPW